MKYLRKFNENVVDECDFETFKEIMYELGDSFNDYTFHDFSSEEEDPFYEIQITISEDKNYFINDDVPSMNYDFLDLGHWDEPESVDPEHFSYKGVYSTVDKHNDSLFDLKDRIDSVVENNKQITKIFKILEESIIPRFKTFSNYEDTQLGFDGFETIRISFEIKVD